MAAIDAGSAANRLKRLKSAAFNFQIGPGRAWLWKVRPSSGPPREAPSSLLCRKQATAAASLSSRAAARQVSMEGDGQLAEAVNPIGGQLLLLSEVFGCPPIRLRMAIPEELLPGAPSASRACPLRLLCWVLLAL